MEEFNALKRDIKAAFMQLIDELQESMEGVREEMKSNDKSTKQLLINFANQPNVEGNSGAPVNTQHKGETKEAKPIAAPKTNT